jgi:hypothetical protein
MFFIYQFCLCFWGIHGRGAGENVQSDAGRLDDALTLDQSRVECEGDAAVQGCVDGQNLFDRLVFARIERLALSGKDQFHTVVFQVAFDLVENGLEAAIAGPFVSAIQRAHGGRKCNSNRLPNDWR